MARYSWRTAVHTVPLMGRHASPALLQALRLVQEGYPIHAACVASGIQPSRVFALLKGMSGTRDEQAEQAILYLTRRERAQRAGED